jgi:hypothetical protein
MELLRPNSVSLSILASCTCSPGFWGDVAGGAPISGLCQCCMQLKFAIVNSVPGCSLHGDRHVGLGFPRGAAPPLGHQGGCPLWLSSACVACLCYSLVGTALLAGATFFVWHCALPLCTCDASAFTWWPAAGRHCGPSCGTSCTQV